MEDLFQLQKRSTAEYIQETVNEPPELGSIKETEEENAGKEGKRIYSLHDLSKDLQKLRYRSDLFEIKEHAMPKISAVNQGEVDTSIKESDSEYDASSEEAENKGSRGLGVETGLPMFMDKAEPLEEALKQRLAISRRIRGVKNVPDAIQEESNDSEIIGDHPSGMRRKYDGNNVAMTQLIKTHHEVNFVVRLMK